MLTNTNNPNSHIRADALSPHSNLSRCTYSGLPQHSTFWATVPETIYLTERLGTNWMTLAR